MGVDRIKSSHSPVYDHVKGKYSQQKYDLLELAMNREQVE
jgi:hypothetical protein